MRRKFEKWEYETPYAEYVEIPVEQGFAVTGNIEEVGKDDEVEF